MNKRRASYEDVWFPKFGLNWLDDPTPPPEEKVEEQSRDEADKVVLSAEQYTGMLDRMTDLEERGSRKVVPLRELVDEGKPERPSRPEARQPSKLLDDMSNKELVDYVFEVADEAFTPLFQQLDTKIETIKVLNEIDKIEKDSDCRGQDGKTDFWLYKDEIYQIASANPKLTIKQAYKLAKQEHGEKSSKSPEREKKATLLTLPPRPVLGERPGPASSVTRMGDPKDIKGAASKAWDEVMGGKDET